MKVRAIVVGAFHEIIELAEETNIQIIGLIDNIKIGTYRNIAILGNDDQAEIIYLKYKNIPLILTPDKPMVRFKLTNHYTNLGFSFISLISKSSKISLSSKIETGSVVQHGVNISSESQIGKFVKLNTASNIMHDCIIGDFTTIAPNAVVLGNVKIGRRCYIGSNSTILPNLVICDDVIIGAGAVVTSHISVFGTYVGIPAQKMLNT